MIWLIVAGNRNKDIGEQLNISIPTVEAHRKKVMQKLQVKTVAELVKTWVIYDSEQNNK